MKLRIGTLYAGLALVLTLNLTSAPIGAEPADAASVTMRDAAGNEGRLHVVQKGDTLWHISEKYFGNAFLWPSLWQDNRQISNPHRIYPGDRLFVTKSGIRRMSAEEAAGLVAGGSARGTLAADDLAPVHFSTLEAAGFLATEDVAQAGTIVSGPADRTLFAQNDLVDVRTSGPAPRAGSEVTIFRFAGDVRDPDTHRPIGRYVDVLGHGSVVEVGDATVRVRIDESWSEITHGDGAFPRALASTTIQPSRAPKGIEGRVVGLPNARSWMGVDDVVYLDHGAQDGVSVGNVFEVYRTRHAKRDARGAAPGVGEDVVARLVVVAAQPKSAVALVTRTSTELGLGERFRTPAP